MRRYAEAGWGFLAVLIVVAAVVIIGTAVYCGLSGNCGGGGGGDVSLADCNSEYQSCQSGCTALPASEQSSCRSSCEANASYCEAGSSSEGLSAAAANCLSTWQSCLNKCGIQSARRAKAAGVTALQVMDTTSISFDECEANCTAERSLCDPCITGKLVCQSKTAICLLDCPAGDSTCVQSCRDWYPLCLNPHTVDKWHSDIVAKVRADLIAGRLGPIVNPVPAPRPPRD
jgi:hypothetical protein